MARSWELKTHRAQGAFGGQGGSGIPKKETPIFHITRMSLSHLWLWLPASSELSEFPSAFNVPPPTCPFRSSEETRIWPCRVESTVQGCLWGTGYWAITQRWDKPLHVPSTSSAHFCSSGPWFHVCPPHSPWDPTLHPLLHAAFAQPWVQPWPSFHPGCLWEAQEKPKKGRKWPSRPLNHDILLHSWRFSHPHFLLPRIEDSQGVTEVLCWERGDHGLGYSGEWCGWGGVTYPIFLVGSEGFKWHNG